MCLEMFFEEDSVHCFAWNKGETHWLVSPRIFLLAVWGDKDGKCFLPVLRSLLQLLQTFQADQDCSCNALSQLFQDLWVQSIRPSPRNSCISSLSKWFLSQMLLVSRFQKAGSTSKDPREGKDYLGLFHCLCDQIPCPIQKQSCIFFQFSSAAYVSVETFFVALPMVH